MQKSGVVVSFIWLAGCGGGGGWNQTSSITATKPFSSAIIAPAQPAQPYGNRRGPASSLWADSYVAVNAPNATGKPSPLITLAPTTHGPEVLNGSLAVFVEGGAMPTATYAKDLSTGVEKWRLLSDESFRTRQVTTDGTVVCGIAVHTPESTSASDVKCADLATGAVKWRKTLSRWLSPGRGYGALAELVIRDNTLFIMGGSQVSAHALADGSQTWALEAFAHARGMVFDGSDLIIETVRSGCVSGNRCLRAVNPTTGATLAEFDAPSASHLWSAGGVSVYLTPSTGSARSTVSYNSATHTFTEDSARALTLSENGVFDNATALLGVSPVLADGSVYLLSVEGSGTWSPQVAYQRKLCRYSTTGTKLTWCQMLSTAPYELRIHPNITIAYSGPTSGIDVMIAPAPGERVTVSHPRFYFGRWGFTQGAINDFR